MRWFKSTVQGAGFAHFGPAVVATVLLAIALLAGFISAAGTGVGAFGVFIGFGTLSAGLEFLSAAAKKRRKELSLIWPEVIDSIYSAVASGLDLVQAFDDLGQKGPMKVRTYFSDLATRLDSGWGFTDGIEQLKNDLGEIHADRFCELLRLVANSGSDSLGTALRMQSQQLRSDIAMFGEIESKQGWVAGTAKLAVAAPWAIVAMLASRPENAQIYNSLAGMTVLLLGFIVSIAAYRLVHLFGHLPSAPRIFA